MKFCKDCKHFEPQPKIPNFADISKNHHDEVIMKYRATWQPARCICPELAGPIYGEPKEITEARAICNPPPRTDPTYWEAR